MILTLVSMALACPDLDQALESAVTHMLAAESTAADMLAAEEALGCAVASSEQAARYFLVRGAALEFETPGSGAAFLGAAKSTAPGSFDERLGADVKAAWSSAATAGSGRLTIDANREGGRVDGVSPKDWPAPVTSGWHVVQVVTTDGKTVLFGKSVNVPANDDALVQTGLPETGAKPVASVTQASERKKKRVVSPAWLIASGVMAGTGGYLAYQANQQSLNGEEAKSLATLEGSYTREKQFAYGAYAAWGVAGVLCGLSFVLP